MSAVDDFLEANHSYAENFAKGDKPLPPAKRVAVVACMDARIEMIFASPFDAYRPARSYLTRTAFAASYTTSGMAA